MTVNRTTVYATAPDVTAPGRPGTGTRRERGPAGPGGIRDLRGRAGRGPHRLTFGGGDLVVVAGLPGGGKSTLMRRAVRGLRVDSQDTRERWDGHLARFLPYALYRPLVRLAHYTALRRALRAGTGAVVHDCGTQSWVRNWLAREARRRGGTLHLLLLDVTPDTALAGQRARGRGVSRRAFLRHRRVTRRLLRSVEEGRPPHGCGSVVVLDRDAADVLRGIDFADRAASPGHPLAFSATTAVLSRR
ncbi:AAA family ATPase [Streptomyces sp. SID2888]|uniref:AAA family ATPase n=1 Tax=Streptomyces sp. SID2888 TaxID=2690256 RepID=UPI00136FF93F|nr:AAA family ATPase [Streptomyces sp. SID2888]MYV49219.1 AAA family ATPase [Streptomyces sp. SID2888]